MIVMTHLKSFPFSLKLKISFPFSVDFVNWSIVSLTLNNFLVHANLRTESAATNSVFTSAQGGNAIGRAHAAN